MLSSALLRAQSDARLAALAGEGHERAFETIVERYSKPLHRYLRRMLPAVRVEDVLQQTFLGAWSSLRDGAEVRELRPWLYRIAHNAGVNALKRSGYDYEELKESLRGSDAPEGDVERRAVMRETLAAVAGLPERQRRALLETAVDGRSQADVAREMGMSEGAFRQLVHRARTTLRTAATAVTPFPMAGWAAAASSSDAPASGLATRIAELAAGAGTAGVGATVVKTGAVIVAAGALAAGPAGVGGGSDPASGSLDGKAARSTTNEPLGGFPSGRPSSSGSSRGEDSGRRGAGRGTNRRDDRRGRGSDDGGGDGEGRRGGGEDDSGGDRSGSDDSSGSGSSGSRSSGSGSSGSGSSGSGSSGSGSSGSGSSGSGSGSSGSGSSGSGSSGSGSSGSGSSGSGSSGSGSSGSGSSGSDGGGSSGSGSSGSGEDSPDSDPDDG